MYCVWKPSTIQNYSTMQIVSTDINVIVPRIIHSLTHYKTNMLEIILLNKSCINSGPTLISSGNWYAFEK